MQSIVIQPKDEREAAFLRDLLYRLNIRHEVIDHLPAEATVGGSNARDYLQDLYDSQEDRYQDRESM